LPGILRSQFGHWIFLEPFAVAVTAVAAAQVTAVGNVVGEKKRTHGFSADAQGSEISHIIGQESHVVFLPGATLLGRGRLVLVGESPGCWPAATKQWHILALLMADP
jgi:hypothetical protein